MIKEISDTSTAGNANADMVVPVKKIYRILFGHVEMITDANVASRRLLIQILDASSNVVTEHTVGATQAASLTYHYELMQGIYRETSAVGLALQVPIPADFMILPEYTIRTKFTNGVAGDDFSVHFVVEETSNV